MIVVRAAQTIDCIFPVLTNNALTRVRIEDTTSWSHVNTSSIFIFVLLRSTSINFHTFTINQCIVLHAFSACTFLVNLVTMLRLLHANSLYTLLVTLALLLSDQTSTCIIKEPSFNTRLTVVCQQVVSLAILLGLFTFPIAQSLPLHTSCQRVHYLEALTTNRSIARLFARTTVT